MARALTSSESLPPPWLAIRVLGPPRMRWSGSRSQDLRQRRVLIEARYRLGGRQTFLSYPSSSQTSGVKVVG